MDWTAFFVWGTGTKKRETVHYLYILYSSKLDRYYKGQTGHVEKRVVKHNRGHSLATRAGVPWELVKMIEFENKRDAIRAENWLKKMKSRSVIEQVIEGEIDLKKIIVG